MAEEFQTGICSGNWWNMSKTRVLMGGSSGWSSTDMGTYGSWLVTDVVDLKPRSCKLQDSISININSNINNNNSVSHDSSVVFQDSQKPQQAHSDSGGSSILMDSTLQMMGFGISSSSSSSSSDWTQTLLRGNGRGETYNSMLQEDMNSSALNSSQIQKDWSPSFTSTGGDSCINGYKAAINQDFTLEQRKLNPLNSSGSCYPSSTTSIQSLFEPDPQSLFNDRTINYSSPQNYGTILNELSPSWPKLSPFLKPSLHFSNNTPFWNASATAINDIRADFLPSSQPQFLLPAFEEEPNCPNLTPKPNNEQIRDSGSHVVKKGSEPPFKRPRIETPSPLPTFKVRKEKLGDRITALQQLVSPFGKTDTASVLHEAIEYIKFLHDQVNALSTPYMKNCNPNIHHQQAADKLKEPEVSKQGLKSRGLCLVPISSTFPVTNETTADFWTPTFGGTFS